MEFLQLLYFQKVAQLENITKAAKELYISQPSLSNSIRRLEQDIGTSLFDRIGKKIILNENGKILLEGAEIAFQALEESQRKISQNLVDYEPHIRIISPLFQAYPDLVCPLLEVSSNCTFFSDPITDEHAIAELRSGRCDFYLAIKTSPETTILEGLCHEQIAVQNFKIIVSKEHPLATHDSLSLSDLKNENFATGSGAKSALNDHFKTCDFEPNVKFLGSQFREVIRAVATGHYILIATERACLCSPAFSDSLVAIDINDYQKQAHIILYWKNEMLTSYQRRIKQIITDFFNLE